MLSITTFHPCEGVASLKQDQRSRARVQDRPFHPCEGVASLKHLFPGLLQLVPRLPFHPCEGVASLKPKIERFVADPGKTFHPCEGVASLKLQDRACLGDNEPDPSTPARGWPH